MGKLAPYARTLSAPDGEFYGVVYDSNNISVALSEPLATRGKARRWAAQQLKAYTDALLNLTTPVVVTLCKPAWKRAKVLARFGTIVDAEDYLATSTTIDPNDLAAGHYGIDAPEEMVNPVKSKSHKNTNQ